MNFPPRIALADFELVWPQPRLAAAFADALNWSYAEHRRFLAGRANRPASPRPATPARGPRRFTLAQGEKRYFLVRGDELLGCLGSRHWTAGGASRSVTGCTACIPAGPDDRRTAVFRRAAGHGRFFLTTSAANDASQRLAERVGFPARPGAGKRSEGPDGQRCATWVYELPPQ